LVSHTNRDQVIHTASPIWLETSDYNKELFQPAIDGTIAVPKAVKNSKANINRVVITSSVSYILDLLKELNPGKNYTESDWNPVTREDTTKGNSIIAYLASKALAENAAWEFVKEHSVSKIATVDTR
jgi:nucleoside-diphosphate-sugar epimerase